jgi:hypothetical protein
MPNEGVDRFLATAVPAYKRVGAADRLVVHRPPGEHALTIEAFEAMFQFFREIPEANKLDGVSLELGKGTDQWLALLGVPSRQP